MERRIVDYYALQSDDLYDLVVAVRDAIKNNWHPFGGLVLNIGAFIQVMVKYEDEEATDE